MTNQKGLGRQASSSVSLGANDPRLRRSNQALTTQTDYDDTIRVGEDGRLGVNPATRVTPIANPTTTADAKVNELIRALYAAGLLTR